MLYDNPAAALQSILEKGMAEKHDQPCHSVWRKLLNVTEQDQGGLIAKLGVVMDLPRRTLVLVRASFPNQLKAAELWSSSIETAFMQQQLGGNWGTFAAHIQPYCVAHLGLTAELIQTHLGAKLIDEVEINRLLDEFSDLVSEIDRSELDHQLKAYLTRELLELQQLLRNYKVSGAVPVLKQTESMLGHSLLDPAYSKFLTNHELGARLLENLTAMANLVTVAVALPQLTHGLSSLLLR